MRFVLVLVALTLPLAARAELPTERYASVQLQVAQEFLQRAQAAARAGERSLAGVLAYQASLDARLAVGMTESAEVRAGASMVASEAHRIVRAAASGGP